MKLSKLTIACLLATSGMSLSTAAYAEITQDFEFGGYVREGVLFSAENDYKSINGGGQKETLGRLGLEYDNDASVNITSIWSFDNGNEIRVSAGIDDEASLSYGLEMTGITPTGSLWGGNRGHGKDNYIFMTDFFYTNMEGTGIGVDGLEFGDFLVDVAYIASYRDDDDYDLNNTSFANNKNLDNYMHTFNTAVTYNSLEVSLSGKVMVDNWDEAGNEYAETGADLTFIYTLDDFFGMGNGQAAIITQAGIGLGSGNLLGSTINSYSAYAPGSLMQGEHEDYAWLGSKGDATRLQTYVNEKDTSARLLIWGGYYFNSGIRFFPSIQAQYNDHYNNGEGQYNANFGQYDYWASAMGRTYFPVNDVMFVQTEVGMVYNNWNGDSYRQQKVTVAPTFILGTGTVTPEIRLLATYVNEAWTVDDGGDFIVGVQTEVNW
jgi:maltoporin